MNHKNNYITNSIIFLVIGILTVVLSQSSVFAQQGQSLTIIPPRFELFSNPGDTVAERIRVRNDSDFPATYTLVVESFSAAGEEGEVVLEEPDMSFSFAKWIEPESREIILQPNEEKSIGFLINVPRDAEPGGHYASLLFASGSEEVEGGASVVQRVGSLLLLRVSGNVVEDAVIETFQAPSFSQSTPIEFSLRVKNNGNVHVRPQGTIIITNMFGKKVDEIPLNSANVIPGAIRKMDTGWERPGALGQYTATLVATYGQQNMPLTAAIKVTVASTTMLILIAIGVVATLLFISSIISSKSRLRKALKVIVSGN